MWRHGTRSAAGLVALLMIGCAGDRDEAGDDRVPGVVEVVARGLTFEAPDRIPAGWVTIRFLNQSPMTHFSLLERLPDGIGIEEQQRQVAPIFQAGMDLLAAGRTDEAMARFGELPEWFPQVVFIGGPGLTAPGHTSETTVYLEPGTYLIECYVKTGGIFHSYNPDTTARGMVRQLVVTDSISPAPEPEAAVRLTVSSARGIEVAGEPVAGVQTVAVHFEDQAVYENFVGHDVHLVRLADGTDLTAVAAWMDWRQPAGLTTPSPAEFLGGLNEMPAGTTGYLTVNLEPGQYAWIAEVPNPGAKGLLVSFSVPDPGGLPR